MNKKAIANRIKALKAKMKKIKPVKQVSPTKSPNKKDAVKNLTQAQKALHKKVMVKVKKFIYPPKVIAQTKANKHFKSSFQL
jgi:hypothetical protein